MKLAIFVSSVVLIGANFAAAGSGQAADPGKPPGRGRVQGRLDHGIAGRQDPLQG
jgi:hypothetical protein